jgi:hypothetical protein
MAGAEETTEKVAQAKGDQRPSYERSTISFPYFDLSDAIRMAEAISTNVGGGDCSDDQLAAWLDLSPKSSGYRARLSAARLFGLIESGKESDHRLTELGLATLDEARRRSAKADAFTTVPLFKRVYEQWRGQQLPPAAALERAMVQMGVADKQTARARQVLERSAQEAAYFEQGRDRLVRPGVKEEKPSPQPPLPGGGSGGGGFGGGHKPPSPDVDPIIAGLLARLPKSGDVWPEQDRDLWLELLKGSFKIIYKDA